MKTYKDLTSFEERMCQGDDNVWPDFETALEHLTPVQLRKLVIWMTAHTSEFSPCAEEQCRIDNELYAAMGWDLR